MDNRAVLLVAFAIFGSSAGQCLCPPPCPPPCLPPCPPIGLPPPCLPPPSPYEGLAAALALPSPLPPPPPIPPCLFAPLGPILPGCGPDCVPLPILPAPPVTVPGPESPVIPLPAPCLPPPQVIAHKCVVSKTVVKPQIYQRLVHVPTVARFLKKSFAPVLENIAYTAVPKCGVGLELPAVLPPCLPVPPCPPPPCLPPPCAC